MPLLVYIVILLVSVVSVALEWDTLVQPSAATWQDMQAVTRLRPLPVARDAAKQDDQPRVVQPANPQTGATTAQAPVPVVKPEASSASAALAAQANANDQAQTAKAPPQCNVSACAAAYFSFRASDCTYQPSFGPRRLCTKGAVADAGSFDAPTLPAGTPCHYRSCAEHYSSFDPSTCTYQPLEGPRRLCER